MKFKVIFMISLMIMFFGCDKGPKEFKITSAEPYAFPMEEGYDLQVGVNVSGFEMKKQDARYYGKLSYSIALTDSLGNVYPGLDNDVIEIIRSEELSNYKVDCQAELNSVFTPGLYKLIITVTDELSEKNAIFEKEFKIE